MYTYLDMNENFPILHAIQSQIDNLLEYFGRYFDYSVIVLHITYILIFFGILSVNPTYIEGFNIIVQFVICLFLLFRFHPFRKHELRVYDSKIIFSSALFLLINLGAVKYAQYVFNEIRTKI
jgi:hypothetical protein